MVQLLFARLPQFKDDTTSVASIKRVKDLPTREITTDTQQIIHSGSLVTKPEINEQQINGKN
jgi:hypothetical protein